MSELCCLSLHSTCGQPGFTSGTCGTFTKNTETIEKIRETGVIVLMLFKSDNKPNKKWFHRGSKF